MTSPSGPSQTSGRLVGRLVRAVLGIFLGGSVFLQAQSLAFRRMDDREGLHQSQVQVIFEDRDGFLWMGTMEGLSRLGASGFSPYRDQEGLRVPQVYCIAQDKAGSIWVGGPDAGVAEIRGSRIRHFGEAEGLSIPTVYSLLVRKNGEVLAGARQGVFRRNGDRFERLPLPEPATYYAAQCLAESTDGLLWIGSNKGRLLSWDGKRVEEAKLPPALQSKRVLALVPDPSGKLWALFPQGVLTQDGKGGWKPIPLPGLPDHITFQSLTISPSGEVYIAMGADGMLFLDAQHRPRILTWKDGLPRESIQYARIDRRGVLWVGADGGYAQALTLPGLRVLENDPATGVSLGLGWVNTFFELPGGRMLLGGERGLHLWEPSRGVTRHWVSPPGLPAAEVWTFIAHPQGGVWVATRKGLWRWTEAGLTPGPDILKHEFLQSMVMHGGRLWVALSGMGLGEFTPEGRLIKIHETPHELGREGISKVIPGEGWPTGPGLLLGTEVGLYHFEINGGTFQRAFAGTPVHTLTASTLYRDPGGDLWVSTSQGVFQFPKGRPSEWKRFGAPEAAIQGTANWIQTLPSRATAIGHGAGISMITPEGVVRLTKNWGLLSDETSTDAVFLDSQKRLWIGLKGGACILDTQTPLPAIGFTKPKVTEVSWGSESRWLPERIELPPLPGTLDILFDTGLPAAPVVPRYQWMIEGMDQTWRSVPTNANSVQVSQLGPGRYRFRLKVCLDGREREWAEADPLEIRVRPAWYQWLFTKILFVLVGVGGVVAAAYLRVKALRKRAKMLEAKVEERTATLALRNKSLERVHHQLKQSLESRVHLMRAVSHDLRSPLTSIMLSVDRIRDNGSAPCSESTLLVLDREAKRLEAIIRSLLDKAKAESFSDNLNQRLCRIGEVLEGLTDTLGLKAEANGLTPHLELDPKGDEVWILADTTALQQVLYNLIENALKFTEAPGTVGIRSRVSQDSWTLEVWDTGRGIDPSKLEDIFQAFRQTEEGDAQKGWGLGLNICRTLVEAHGGRIEVESALGKGSIFRVVLPLVGPSPEHHA